MTVSAINNAAQPLQFGQTQAVDQAAFQQKMQQAMGPVAQLFGESAQQLMQQLASGSTSLSALAQSKGVSQSDLLAAIQKGLQQAGGPAASMSSTQLANLASTIANRVHKHHHHGGGGGGGMSDVDSVGTTDRSSHVSAANASSASAALAILGGDTDGDGDGSQSNTSATSTSSVPSATTAQQVSLAQLLLSLQTSAATATAQSV